MQRGREKSSYLVDAQGKRAGQPQGPGKRRGRWISSLLDQPSHSVEEALLARDKLLGRVMAKRAEAEKLKSAGSIGKAKEQTDIARDCMMDILILYSNYIGKEHRELYEKLDRESEALGKRLMREQIRSILEKTR